MSEPAVEVSVSAPCEHGTFTVQVGSPGVWLLPGLGRIESAANERWVFHREPEICACWEEEGDEGESAETAE